VAVGAGAVWVAASRDGTLARVDPRTGDVTTVEVGDNPDSVLVAFDSVWVSVTGENKIVRLSTTDQPEIVDEFEVGAEPEGLAASSRAIWVANAGDGSVSQIVEATGDVRNVPDVADQPVDVAVGAGAVWVANAAGSSVTRIDGGRLEVALVIEGVGPSPRALTIVDRDVWVATSGDGRIHRINGDENSIEGSVRVGGTPRDVATDGAFLYVTDREGDRLVTVDAQAEQVVERETVEDGPLNVAVGDDDLWVTRFDAGELNRIPRE
jgi:DNA-binding beta-propeller fold protein YncE